MNWVCPICGNNNKESVLVCSCGVKCPSCRVVFSFRDLLPFAFRKKKTAGLVPVKPPEPVTPDPAPVVPVKPPEPVTPDPAPTIPVKPAKPVTPDPAPTIPVKPAKPVTPDPAPTIPVKPAKPVTPDPAPTIPVKPAEKTEVDKKTMPAFSKPWQGHTIVLNEAFLRECDVINVRRVIADGEKMYRLYYKDGQDVIHNCQMMCLAGFAEGTTEPCVGYGTAADDEGLGIPTNTSETVSPAVPVKPTDETGADKKTMPAFSKPWQGHAIVFNESFLYECDVIRVRRVTADGENMYRLYYKDGQNVIHNCQMMCLAGFAEETTEPCVGYGTTADDE